VHKTKSNASVEKELHAQTPLLPGFSSIECSEMFREAKKAKLGEFAQTNRSK
jgi:hypothetical protein